MSGPHRNHVEARSSRAPARQFVSETHDHKPDAPSKAQIYDALNWSSDMIVAAGARLRDDFSAFTSAVDAFAEASRTGGMVDRKLAAEKLKEASSTFGVLAAHHSKYIHDEASLQARKAVEHINRRPRP